MTRALRNRILKDANGDFEDHLRNHIHLTNCIHLKKHMQKHSPILNDKSLMRDLVALQRSRSLRDPSASPPRHSPIIADLIAMDSQGIESGRRSIGIEHPREDGRLLGNSLALKCFEGGGNNYLVGLGSEHSSRCAERRHRGKESSRKNDLSQVNEGPQIDMNGNEPFQIFLANSDRGSHKSDTKVPYSQEPNPKTLSQQLSELPASSEEVMSSDNYNVARHSQPGKVFDEAEISVGGSCSGLNKVRRRKFRRVKRTIGLGPREIRPHKEISFASNSSVKGAMHPNNPMEEEGNDLDVSRAPRNGCGIPFNWSRIHNRGKLFLDMAGRSLSCGLSDPRLKRGGPMPCGRGTSDFCGATDQSSSYRRSDGEALPLLHDGSGSQKSADKASWAHDYSGELGIFADGLLKHDVDSDLASEATSVDQCKLKGGHYGRHQNLTQKYMPRTFRDLVGQNLVAQALSNAVVRRKVGMLYVFYGPHGTGKTSSARIFARALSCASPEHPRPCGFCGSCIAHDTGKSRNTKEVGPVSDFDFKSIMGLLDNMAMSQRLSQYRVFIFDDCDNLSSERWSAMSKVIDRAPRHLVFILICSSLDALPHIIISRCQKFLFPKLKDADIIFALRWIATKENLEIDKDAVKLIAFLSDGSLRDAEMTLEQLSLLGGRISVSLVQELVGLISDEQLVDLLDFALSADTVNTVKNLREIMESGVEPLDLMSQLATVITDILAGTCDLTRIRRRRKFFRRQPLSKEDMEKLRQGLKTLSESEKQLRLSNDKLTWLTSVLLQLAPDQQYILPSSSVEDTSFSHSPVKVKNGMEGGMVSKCGRHISTHGKVGKHHVQSLVCAQDGSRLSGSRKQAFMVASRETFANDDTKGLNGRQDSGKALTEIENIWLEVLDNIQISCVKELMYQEGKLTSVSYGAAPTVQLLFSSPQTKSKAEKLRAYILEAFEFVLGSPVTIEIRCESQEIVRLGAALVLPSQEDGSGQVKVNSDVRRGCGGISGMIVQNKINSGNSEIVELASSLREQKFRDHVELQAKSDKRGLQDPRIMETERFREQNQCRSMVKSKVSLAHVMIQHTEGSVQPSPWTRCKAVSIAEKLEQENLRMEPRASRLLCWKTSRKTRQKLSRLKIRKQRPQSLLKLVSCGRCLSSWSPR